MKTYKRLLSILLVLLPLGTGACKKTAETPKQELQAIKISPEEAEIIIGASIQLSGASVPENISIEGARWTSTDNNIAQVDDNGKVTAMAEGEAEIRLSLKGKRGTCKIKVVPAPIVLKGISVSFSSATVKKGEKVQLSVLKNPENYQTEKKIEWQSDNGAVASVSQEGLVEALGDGSATIKAKLEGFEASCIIKVYSKTAVAQLSFFQLNLWEGLKNVEGGLQVFLDQLAALKPDVASFCEFPFQGEETTEGPSAEYILKKAIDYMQAKTGIRYYKTSMTGSGTRGVLTRYPIVEGATKIVSKGTPGIQPWYYRTVINFNGKEIAIYSSHATPYYYACYLPRGYGDGSTPYGWNKLADGPITDINKIMEREEKAGRKQLAIDLENDAKVQEAMGRLCIFGGDLNQPSHLDWTKATASMFQHNGCIVPWTISSYLLANGFKDAYREIYPNPVTHPGNTWPVYNKDAKKSTVWAADADERDRIDYVYFKANPDIKIISSQLVGPEALMAIGVKENDTFINQAEELISPANDKWASDHRGLFMKFEIRHPQ